MGTKISYNTTFNFSSLDTADKIEMIEVRNLTMFISIINKGICFIG